MTRSVHVRLHEWEAIAPGDDGGAALRGATFPDDATRQVAARLARAGVLVVRELRDGLQVEATSFVGRIRLGDLTITVEPKMARAPLLRLVRYARGLRDLTLANRAAFEDDGPLFQDLLVAELLSEADDLLRRGLHRRYRMFEEDLASPRGRIDVTRLAARGASAATSLPCRHHARSDDWLLNQVLLGGLRLAAAVTTVPSLRVQLGRVIAPLAAAVSTVSLHGALVARAQRTVDRQAAHYAPALALIDSLLGGRGLTLDDGDETFVLPGFLFDMNRFFQALLARFLREHLAGFAVEEEHAIASLMRYAPRANPRNQRAPRPRPDFTVVANGRVVGLLDAKYRDLWARSLPREMLYQLAIYALSQPAGGAATILYPTLGGGATEARIEIREPKGNWGRTFVVLRPVDLIQLDALLSDRGTGPTIVAKQAAYASKLAFGASARHEGLQL